MYQLLIALTLAACVDAPDVGTVFECTATFYCDEQPFTITPTHGCTDDEREAIELFEQRLDVLTRDAICTSRRYESACRDTGERCAR